MQTDNPLLGTWRSDKELTPRYWTDVPASFDSLMQHLAERLRKLERSVTRDTSISRLDGDRTERKYSITSLDTAQFKIYIYEDHGKPDEQTTLHLVSPDVYRVPGPTAGSISGRYRELVNNMPGTWLQLTRAGEYQPCCSRDMRNCEAFEESMVFLEGAGERCNHAGPGSDKVYLNLTELGEMF